MRSRSSVLSHILGSNNDICGYSELLNSYTHKIDLMNMRMKLYYDLKCDLKNKYLLDKLLHNKLDISKGLLETITPKVIFLLRKPESTIKSTFQMGKTIDDDWYKSFEKISEYYCSRLSRLEEYAEIMSKDYFFLESDDLVNNTDNVLKDITKWLGLNTPLDNSYSLFNKTGKPGYGDPSDNIQNRKIKKTKNYSDIEIPQGILQITESSYEKCKASLMKI